jgi:hypothetical protein
MAQLIYNTDRAQVYLTELDNEYIIDIDEHTHHHNVSSRIIFTGCEGYYYCEKFLKTNFSIDLDDIIED